ncbi:hypothetical protein ACFYUD_17085 [Nocardia tengchongensis]|uniref:hypothetical protein n=1 Tax=Nocardia tengchongensis TaxID=2055889 RepID=UPI0036A1800D
MSGHVRWQDIRREFVERAGGEDAFAAAKQELLAELRQGDIECATADPGSPSNGGNSSEVNRIG